MVFADALSYLLYWRVTEEEKLKLTRPLTLSNGSMPWCIRNTREWSADTEDSSSYPKVTHPLEYGGLGFDMAGPLVG
ncbi:hypothetical protein [Streptococcus sp.]|uniref:hypothetical protein n=1 Tax=Streptococcus sp. TaxID=1306 RepID=UPI0039190E6A